MSLTTSLLQDISTFDNDNNNKFIYIALGLQLMHVISQALYNICI